MQVREHDREPEDGVPQHPHQVDGALADGQRTGRRGLRVDRSAAVGRVPAEAPSDASLRTAVAMNWSLHTVNSPEMDDVRAWAMQVSIIPQHRIRRVESRWWMRKPDMAVQEERRGRTQGSTASARRYHSAGVPIAAAALVHGVVGACGSATPWR